MRDHDFATLLSERMEGIARDVAQEVIHEYMSQVQGICDASVKLREQLALIRAKEYVTVKEVALLFSCSESHIRKLLKLTRKGKSHNPIPFVDMEGVTVFPLRELLDWASPKPQSKGIQNSVDHSEAA